ncbi:methyltransferase domain-containing protein [Kribbella sp. NPDC058245]|uniref:methyltransferase domain-containing protein n=1 Tax=Kribbella sp. NPDC058245 TaxID=3346399 RepID=UPI0036EF1FD3
MDDPAGFRAVDAAAGDYFVRFLDARAEVPAELVVKGAIAGLLDVQVGMAVLDVGSGTGDDLIGIAALVGEGGRAVGVDVSTAMVTEARRRTAEAGVPAEFVVGDATRLEFADAGFDRLRAERVLMAMADPETAVREMVRVTRPGGWSCCPRWMRGRSSSTALTASWCWRSNRDSRRTWRRRMPGGACSGCWLRLG